MLTKQEAINKLKRQSLATVMLKTQRRGSPEFKKWHRDTEIAIENSFGIDSRHLQDFNAITYTPYIFSLSDTEEEYQQIYKNGLDQADAVLQSMVDEIEEYRTENEENKLISVSGIARVQILCQQFHNVSRQIRHRHAGRPTLEVEDEYDVQDLMNALLIVEFDDIRREESSPSYAGGSSRVDFLLKKEQIILEIKKTRKGLGAKQIGEELMIDIQRYKAHPDCQSLICFVYDPEARVSNPRGLVTDLSGEHDGISVHVIITPTGL